MSAPSRPDHPRRMALVDQALGGLSVGDAFAASLPAAPRRESGVQGQLSPPLPWRTTGETELALGLRDALDGLGQVDADVLAVALARRFRDRPDRGFGLLTRELLGAFLAGRPWWEAGRALAGPGGSRGNGAASRAALVGAYFHDDLDRLVHEAQSAAMVTHGHPDAQAGAVAVALAASWVLRRRAGLERETDLLRFAHARTPEGDTRAGLAEAMALPEPIDTLQAADTLGSGLSMLSSDTVPFALWCASRSPGDLAESLWRVAAAPGPRSITCAIVGALVALSGTPSALPEEWIAAREELILYL